MRISHDTAHENLIKVFNNFVDNNNENNELYEKIPTEKCEYHTNVSGEEQCWDKKCKHRFEKKYTRKFDELWATRSVLFRLLDKYYEDMKEERRLGRQPRRLDF